MQLFIKERLMTQQVVSVADLNVGNDNPFTLFAGMNVLESRDLAMQVAEHLGVQAPWKG